MESGLTISDEPAFRFFLFGRQDLVIAIPWDVSDVLSRAD